MRKTKITVPNYNCTLLLSEATLFTVIAGLIFWNPVSILKTVTLIIGVVFVCFGLYRTISGYVAATQQNGGYFDLIFGIINVILGILFCIHPAESVVGIVYIFLALFWLKSILLLIFAIKMARARFGHYIMNIIAALGLVGIATVLMFYPLKSAIAMTIVLGILLLAYAIADVYMFIQIHRIRRMLAK